MSPRTMLALQLLGGLVLVNPDGVALGRAAQRRRLALLAILASPAGTPVAREKLLGLLWPEVPPDDARHRLSVALYDLRTALGAQAVRVTPQDVLLVPGALGIDTSAFEEACAGNDWDRAAELYRGPFLDGVYLVDAPEFERWVDVRRAALQRLYATAIEKLAQRHERAGATAAALAAWRALLELDPYSGRATLGVMRALDAAGDRAGAVLHGRAHAELLRTELDAGPDAGVEQLIRELQQRTAAAPPQPEFQPAAAVPPTEVLPAPAGGQPVRRRELRTRLLVPATLLLILAAFGAATVVSYARGAGPHRPSAAVLGAMDEAESDMRAGRFDAAVDGFTRAVAADSTFALGHFRLAVATLWADRPGADLDRHINHAQRWAARLDGPDALLLAGFVEWRRGFADGAEALYRRALAIDSLNAEAWYLFGESLFHYGPLRGTPIERARAAFERAVALQPRHYGALAHLAQLALLDGDVARFRSLTDRIITLGPDAVRTLEVQLLRASTSGSGAEFELALERLRTADHSLLFGLGWRLAVMARAPQAARQVHQLLTPADRPQQARALGYTQLTYLDVAAGRPGDALARNRLARAATESVVVDPWTELLPAVLLAAAGSVAELGELRTALAGRLLDPPGPEAEIDLLGALGWAESVLDDGASARARVQQLERIADSSLPPDIGAAARRRARLIEGALALSRGNHAQALRLLDAALTTHWFGNAALNLAHGQTIERWLRAQALFANGRARDADAVFAGFAAHTTADLALLVPALLTRAAIARQQSDDAAARSFCTRAAALWHNAEPPLLAYLRRVPACTFEG